MTRTSCKTALTAFLKALGYYLAYRLIGRVTSDALVWLVQTCRLTAFVQTAVLTKWMSLTVHAVTATAIVLWFVLRRRPLRPSLGLAPLKASNALLCVLCGGGATVTVSWLYDVIPFPEAWVTSYADRSGALFEGYNAWTFVLTVLAAPLMEEAVFRGLVFRRLRGGMPFWAAALLSAAAFGVTHASLLWMLYAFALGLLLAWLTERTGSLWASVLCHFGFNLVGQVSVGVLPFPLYEAACLIGVTALLYSLWMLHRYTERTDN